MRLRWLLCVASVGALALGLSSCGGSDSANTPPEPVIDSPAAGASFKAGDTLRIEVSASDTQDGMLPTSSLTWWVDFHHDTHTHPFVQRTQGTGGTASVPTRGETSDNVWLRIHVRATDSAGVIAEVTRDVLPQKVQIALVSEPAGLQLTLDGQPVTAPFTVTGMVGLERDLGAPDQVFNGRRFRFGARDGAVSIGVGGKEPIQPAAPLCRRRRGDYERGNRYHHAQSHSVHLRCHERGSAPFPSLGTARMCSKSLRTAAWTRRISACSVSKSSSRAS